MSRSSLLSEVQDAHVGKLDIQIVVLGEQLLDLSYIIIRQLPRCLRREADRKAVLGHEKTLLSDTVAQLSDKSHRMN